jgi:hypothetical protein
MRKQAVLTHVRWRTRTWHRILAFLPTGRDGTKINLSLQLKSYRTQRTSVALIQFPTNSNAHHPLFTSTTARLILPREREAFRKRNDVNVTSDRRSLLQIFFLSSCQRHWFDSRVNELIKFSFFFWRRWKRGSMKRASAAPALVFFTYEPPRTPSLETLSEHWAECNLWCFVRRACRGMTLRWVPISARRKGETRRVDDFTNGFCPPRHTTKVSFRRTVH